MSKEVHSITFAPDHVAIQYMDLPTDVRDAGRVALTHQAQLYASHPDYREAIQSLHRRAVSLLEDGLENWRDSEPYLPEADDDEDERGMGE